jgi:hypothetical protein
MIFTLLFKFNGDVYKKKIQILLDKKLLQINFAQKFSEKNGKNINLVGSLKEK